MFPKNLSGALLACALLAFPSVTRAQGQLTLSQAVESAWSRAVEAAESTGQARRAEAALLAARAPWAAAPALELQQRQDRTAQGRDRETDAALVVPLWLPGQRSARIGAATAETAASHAAQEAMKLRVAGQVRDAQWNYHAQLAEKAAAEAQLRTLADLARDVGRRVAAGDLARTDVLAADAEELTAQVAVASARQRVAAALSRWRALTGLNEVPSGEPAAAGLPSVVPEGHPYLKAARAGVQLAQGRLEATRLSRRESPELTIGARREVPAGGGPDSRGLGIALRIPFATQDRNQP